MTEHATTISLAILLAAASIAFAIIFAGRVFAVQDSTNVNLQVVSSCNNNGVCDSGENQTNCAADCTPHVSGSLPIRILNVVTSPAATTSVITWETDLSGLSVFSWGVTPDHELGSIAETISDFNHGLLLESLTPDTLYYFRIFVHETNNLANTAEYLGTFRTTASEDTTPPSNGSSFVAEYNVANDWIDLDWENPTDPDFLEVRIMRRTDFFPTDENDGEFVYQGSAEHAEDTNIMPGTRYYYTLFARDVTGNWSSGIVDDAVVPVRPCVGPDCEPPCVGADCPPSPCIENCVPTPCVGAECPPGEGDPGDPFEHIPTASTTDPLIEGLVFDFIQNGRVIARWSGGDVYVDGTRDLTIKVDYEKLPEILKTIGVSLRDPEDGSKTFSFLLRVTPDKNRYDATIGLFDRGGTYPLVIYVFNHENQRIKKFEGRLIVRNVEFFNSPITQALQRVVAPIGISVGLATGITNTLLITTSARSLFDIYLLVMRLFGALFGFLGVRRKSKPWGTVYDSVTKRPLDPAYVLVRTTGDQEKADAITDLDGRYGFLLGSGSYVLSAQKTHYEFPSRRLFGKGRDELYENLYFGEPVTTTDGEIITRNIPLDPIGFDWNEFVKNKQKLFRLHTRRESIKNFFFNAFYIFGLLSTIFASIVSPSVFNFVVLGLYGVIFIVQTFWRSRHRAVVVMTKKTNDPLSFAIIRVYLAHLNQEVKTVVADEFGRFYILVAPGFYYITVDAKQSDGSYSRLYQSEVMHLPAGVLKKDILI